MVSLERSGGSTSGDHVHHWSLDFNEVQVPEILSNVINNLVSSLEDLSDIVVHDEVQISLSVASIFVKITLTFWQLM